MNANTIEKMSVRQQLSLMKKRCLVDRVMVLSVTCFLLFAAFAICFAVLLRERKMRTQLQCAYESTIDANAQRARFRRLEKKQERGIPLTSQQLTKEP